jgi:hypothetical protein
VKLHQFGALAVLSWYMILPPPSSLGQRLKNAPLWDWKRLDTFDSEGACREMRAKLIKEMPSTGIDAARCVPDDYLKGQRIPQKVSSNIWTR